MTSYISEYLHPVSHFFQLSRSIGQITAFGKGVTLFNATVLVVSANIAIHYILPKQILWVHFCRRQYRSSNQFAIAGFKSQRIQCNVAS